MRIDVSDAEPLGTDFSTTRIPEVRMSHHCSAQEGDSDRPQCEEPADHRVVHHAQRYGLGGRAAAISSMGLHHFAGWLQLKPSCMI